MGLSKKTALDVIAARRRFTEADSQLGIPVEPEECVVEYLESREELQAAIGKAKREAGVSERPMS